MIQRLQARREEGGFTLIELLIVIIILGILAAIVVFAVSNTRKDSVVSSCKTDFKSMELSAEAVNTKMGKYPATDQVDVLSGTGVDAAHPFVVTPVASTPAPGNALLADNTQNTKTTPASSNGALLKSWPSSSDYQLYYEQTGSGTGFTLSVYKSKDSSDFGAKAGTTNTVADCQGLS